MTAALLYNPLDPHMRADPYPVYSAMREHDPVIFAPSADMWFVTSHEHCRAVLLDERFSASEGQLLRHRRDPLPTSMLNSDGPEHTRLRRAVAPAFEPRALVRCSSWVREIVSARVQAFSQAVDTGADVDIITEFARPVAVAVLGRFLGVPDDEMTELTSWSRSVSVNVDPFADPDRDGSSSRQMHDMLLRFADHLHAKASAPQDDALSVIAQAHSGGLVSATEALSTVTLLVVGGIEPIVGVIGNAVAALVGTRAEELRPNTSIQTATEELLRFDSPIQFTARRAVADIDLGTQRIATGGKVVVLLGAANRDPGRFDDADRIVLHRPKNPHFAFGAGVHTCLGAPLVRLIAQAIGEALPRPIPTLFKGWSAAVRSPSVVPRGYHYLPVRRSTCGR